MGIKNKIIELGDNINIDLRPITHIMNKIGVHLIDASIVGTTPALCVPGKIYLDLNKIKSIRSYELVPFIMLHEIAHFKRYTNPYLDLDFSVLTDYPSASCPLLYAKDRCSSQFTDLKLVYYFSIMLTTT